MVSTILCITHFANNKIIILDLLRDAAVNRIKDEANVIWIGFIKSLALYEKRESYPIFDLLDETKVL